jgi:hypothetical protein
MKKNLYIPLHYSIMQFFLVINKNLKNFKIHF